MVPQRKTGWVTRVYEHFAFIQADGDGVFFGHKDNMPSGSVLPEGTHVAFTVMPRRKRDDKYDRAVCVEVI